MSYDDIDLLKVLNMDPVPANAATMMPAWLKGLEGKRIRIRGFMYPTFQQTGDSRRSGDRARSSETLLLRPQSENLRPLRRPHARRRHDRLSCRTEPFDVVGVFHIRPEAEAGKLYHLYEMDDATVISK